MSDTATQSGSIKAIARDMLVGAVGSASVRAPALMAEVIGRLPFYLRSRLVAYDFLPAHYAGSWRSPLVSGGWQRFEVSPGMRWSRDIAMKHGLHDREVLALIGAAMSANPSGWIIDVGANVGVFAIEACAAGAKTLMVEPIPELANETLSYIRSLGLWPPELAQVCLGKEPGRARFSVFDDAPWLSSLHGDRVRSDARRREIDTEIITMNSLLDRHRISPSGVALVKIDAEGHDLEVLQGGDELWKTGVPWVVIEVNVPGLAQEADAHMGRFGYRGFSLRADGYRVFATSTDRGASPNRLYVHGSSDLAECLSKGAEVRLS